MPNICPLRPALQLWHHSIWYLRTIGSTKRIALLGPAYPFRGGLAAFTERLALEYQNQGHQVKVFTFTTQYPNFLFPGKSQFVEDTPAPDLDIERTLSSVNPTTWPRTRNRIRSFQPDMLLTAYWMPFMGACLGNVHAGLSGKCTRVGIMHNVVPHETRKGDAALTRYFTKRCDAFVTMTDAVSDDLEKFDLAKPRIQSPHPIYDHFGPDVPRAEAVKALGLDEKTKYVLFFGLIREYKGLDILLEAYANVRSKLGDVKLLVAGEFYADRQKFIEVIEEAGLKDQVVLHDHFIPDSKVGLYFSAADLLALPYRSATQSGVTQIAYHFGLPMLVTNVGGLPEMVPHGKVGYTVDPNSDAVGEALVDYFVNDRGEQFRDGVQNEKVKYEWDTMARLILDLHFKAS